MIFIDANVPMYLVGATHPRKSRVLHLLERAAVDHERLVTDAEVMQEILYRYVAIGRRDAIRAAFDVLFQVADEVFPIDVAATQRANSIVLSYPNLSARDAIHVATMQQRDVARIMSFDAGFDQVTGLTRIDS